VVDASTNSKWYSRSMGILGSLLLIFLIVHISKFFVETKIALYLEGDAAHNLFESMKAEFQHGYIVAIYSLGVISLFWHLLHGFSSAFQSLGIHHKRYTPIIQSIGAAYAFIVCLLFLSMPIAFYFGWVA